MTHDEIRAWVAAVAPRWLHPERSYEHYVRSWNVAGKVRAAKLAGTFDDVIARPASAWHARLALAAIV